jgi:hypothetical protein
MGPRAIYRLKGVPAKLLGNVEAPDEETAIKRAIEEFHVAQSCRNGCWHVGDDLPMGRSGQSAKNPHVRFRQLLTSSQSGYRQQWALCHEQRRSTRRCVTVREMKVGPSSSAIRC